MSFKLFYLRVYLANVECGRGAVKCGGSPPRDLCIDQSRLCDGFDHCGNNWDELPDTCGQFAGLYMLCNNNNNNNKGRRIALCSGDDRESFFLFQRVSVVVLHDSFCVEDQPG